MAQPGDRGTRPGRADSREAVELRAIREAQPQLTDAVDMHLELVEVYRRVRGRVTLPSLDLSREVLARHQAEGRPVLRFEDIPLDVTDLRLLVRQTAEILRRHGEMDLRDYERIQALGRDMTLAEVVGQWYRQAAERHVVAAIGSGAGPTDESTADAMLAQVIALSMRPFLSRCAEVLQQHPSLALWTHAHCALCGGEPDLAYITPGAERHLICGRCTLRWKFESLTCPYCGNADRGRITSFATSDGLYRVYACDACKRYLKAFDGRHADRPVLPIVDLVATLPLDAAAMQRGYS